MKRLSGIAVLGLLVCGWVRLAAEEPSAPAGEFPANPAPAGALVFEFQDVKQLLFPQVLLEKGSSLSILPDGTYGKTMVELSYNFTTPENVIGEVFFMIPNTRYEKDFSGYSTFSFWVKPDAQGAYMRDRVKVAFYSNIQGGKWVHFRPRVNERQDILPELYLEKPEWKKIVLDLDKGPFYDWNVKHPEYVKIFPYNRSDFPWDKVFAVYVVVEKFESKPHQGKVCFSRFLLAPGAPPPK